MVVGPLLGERVWDITTTTGTGTLTLSNSPSKSFQSFLNGIGDGNSCHYCIQEQSGSNWEVGIGTYTDSGTTLSRDTVLASSNSGALVNFASGTKDVLVTVNATAAQRYRPNLLSNSGFWFWQRQAPATVTAIPNNAADQWNADRWRAAVPNNGSGALAWSTSRIDTLGALETGLLARYYGKYIMNSTAFATTNKMIVGQTIESYDTFNLASKMVVFQCKMKASAAKTMRLGIIQATSAATADTFPTETGATGTHSIVTGSGSQVPSFGANGTDPTFATNLAKIAPNKVLPGGTASIVNTALNCSVTTSWQQFGAVFIMPSNAKNLMPAIWTDSTFSLNDYFCISEAGLFLGNTLAEWNPDSYDDELYRCQRYYQKSYDTDVAPGTASVEGSNRLSRSSDNSNYLFDSIWFNPPMRGNPTFLVWDEGGHGTFTTRCFANGVTDNGVGSTQVQVVNTRRCRLASSSPNPLAGYGIHFTFASEL
jgi:hypothetical protein